MACQLNRNQQKEKKTQRFVIDQNNPSRYNDYIWKNITTNFIIIVIFSQFPLRHNQKTKIGHSQNKDFFSSKSFFLKVQSSLQTNLYFGLRTSLEIGLILSLGGCEKFKLTQNVKKYCLQITVVRACQSNDERLIEN